MEKIKVKGLKREKTGKEIAKKLRRGGFIPGIIYGKDINLPIQVPLTELKVLRAHHFSESILIEVVVEDKGKTEAFATVIKNVQFHPLTEEVIHLDFLRVSMEEKIRVRVPLLLKGESKAAKEGAILEQMLWEVEVEAFPLDILEKIEVDISSLEIGHSIHVGDLNLGDKVRIIERSEETIATIVSKEEEAEEVAEEAEGAEEPEVIKEKKATEGEEK